jgi:hypothetical protein
VKLGIILFLIFAGFLALDVLLASVFDDAWTALFFLNIVVGQLTLICVWGTLVEGTFWVRFPWTILLLVISWAALAFGAYLDLPSPRAQLAPALVLGLGMVWFYGFAISYIPLKIAAWVFGWKITQAGSVSSSVASTRYAIRDIMIGTAILAVVLSIGRILIPGALPPWSSVLKASGLDRLDVLIAFLIFSIVGLAVKLPCIWIALAMTREKVFSRSVAWFFLSGLLGLIEFLIISSVIGRMGPRVGVEICAGLISGHMAMAAIMIGVLYVLRLNGYQLSRSVSK